MSKKEREKLDLQQKKILGAAIQTFAETGYVGTKISTIAAAAGVSYGLVHHYFGSKEQLFTASVEAGLNFLQETSKLALINSANPDEKLRRWIYSFTIGIGQMNVYQFFSRLVMQIIGTPGIHPPACIEMLNQMTANEVHLLSGLLTELRDSAENSFHHACLLFNTLLGSQMFGTKGGESLQLLYETGCNMLRIDPHPVPASVPLPELPWLIDEIRFHC